MRKILITGKNGQVGWELQRTLAPLGDVVAAGRHEIDLADPDSIRRVIREAKPDLIVNAAAYTAVDKAESEPDIAMRINGVAPGLLAEEARRLNAAIVHFSTDYVFDGASNRPYAEDDAPNPLNVYGKTKLAGERAIQAVGAPYLIIRSSWIYGNRGRNFLLTILKKFSAGSELKIVEDQHGAPTWSRLLAETTAQILARNCPPDAPLSRALDDIAGLYHASSEGKTSWYGFARKIIESCSHMAMKSAPRVVPVSTADYPVAAARPRNSCMSNAKLAKTCGLTLPDWEKSLELCLDEVANCRP